MLFALFCLTMLASFPAKTLSQEVPPSCEDQLTVAQSALFFARASRNATEENAARVVMELQKQANELRSKLAKMKPALDDAHPAPKTERNEE